MHEFTDKTGAIWRMDLTVGAIRRVRDVANIDLYQLAQDWIGDQSMLQKLITDHVRLCEVLYAACYLDANAAGIRLDDFCERMGPEEVEAGGYALLEELVLFFPPAVREVLRKSLELSRAATREAGEKILAALNDPQTQSKIAQTWSALSGNTPESAASTPTR